MSLPVTTTFTIEGYRIKQYLGVVRGIIVRAPTIAQGILGGLKSIIGGPHRRVHRDVRAGPPAGLRPADRPRPRLGANAIVGLRYDASEIGRGQGSARPRCSATARPSSSSRKIRSPGQ